MARKRTSGGEAWIEVVALLPWWLGVSLAIVSYFVFHALAGKPLPAAVRPDQVGPMMTQSFIRALSVLAQYVVPLIGLAGAGVSAWRRRERRTLVADVAQSKAADALDGMTWQRFEQLVGEAFRLQGYSVQETGGGGADGGVDLMLTKGGEKFLVQCKQWKAFKVGVDVVRELYGVMAARGATGGFVVTSGRFTSDATQFASGRNIKLVDGSMLRGLIQQALASGTPTPSADAPTRTGAASSATTAVPACPLCSAAMVKRLAKRGARAKSEFWGCGSYPKCRGTRPIG